MTDIQQSLSQVLHVPKIYGRQIVAKFKVFLFLIKKICGRNRDIELDYYFVTFELL